MKLGSKDKHKKSANYRPGGHPFRLSASAIGTFECPYNGYLSYIQRREPKYPDGINRVFGSSFHEVIETAYKHNRLDPLFLERALYLQFDKNVQGAKMPSADMKRVTQFRSMIPDVVANTMALCVAADICRPPFEIEKKHILTYRGWEVAIIIDLLMKDSKGGLHVYDWKTGRAMNWDKMRPLTTDDVDDHIQLTLYDTAVIKLHGKAPVSVNLLYPRDEVRLSLPSRSKSHRQAFAKKANAVIDCVEKFEKTNDKSLFVTNPTPGGCKFCDHKDICPDVHPDALKPVRSSKPGGWGMKTAGGRKKKRSTQDLIKTGMSVRRPKKMGAD